MTASTTRRGFLGGIAAAASGLLFSSHASAAAHAFPASLSSPQHYKLYTVGRMGNCHPDARDTRSKNQSAMTEINTRTGELRSMCLPIYSGHQVIPLASGQFFVVSQLGSRSALVEPDFKSMRPIKAPEGYAYSGHGILLPNQQHVALSLKPKKDQQTSSAIAIFDLSSQRFIKQIDSQGTGPHDMSLMPDGKTIAIAYRGSEHYGEDEEQQQAESGAVGLFDTESLSITRMITQGITAPIIHLTSTDTPHVFGVTNVYYPGSKKRDVHNAVAKDFPHRQFKLHYLEKSEGVVQPSPIIQIDTDNNKATAHLPYPTQQRRSQSIIFQRHRQKTVANFTFSDTLAVTDMDGNTTIHDSKPLGITSPIALAELPGTPYIAVGGLWDDVAIVDCRTMKTAALFHAHLYRCSHFSTVAV